jgi:T4 bacteriophage base plate protein
MSLPKIALPTFTLNLPVSKRKVECRPYLVKEEKILLMAATDMNPKAIANATRQVINACVMEKDFDIVNLPSLDADYIFINLRAKSVGEVQSVEVTCNHTKDDNTTCNNKFSVEVSLTDLNYRENKTLENKIELADGIGVKMKPTTFKATMDVDQDNEEIENRIVVLYNSIEQIYTKDEVYTTKDFTLEEFIEWMDNLNTSSLEKMLAYIADLPTLSIEKSAVCNKCGHNHELKFNDPLSFF